METAVLPFIGAVNPIVPLIFLGLAVLCSLAGFVVRLKWGKLASLKFRPVTHILAIIASILWVDWLFAFLWGFLLIWGLEDLRKEQAIIKAKAEGSK